MRGIRYLQRNSKLTMAAPIKTLHVLDDLDQHIINHLRKEPRATSTALATQLNVAEATVTARIRALERNGVMRISAQRDFRAAGFEVLAYIDISVAGRPVQSVAQDIAKIDNISIVTLVMGDPAIMLLAMATSLANLQAMVLGEIAKISGVRCVETMIISEVLKYQSEFASLAGEDAHEV
jgi:DNA-binding Lrp family transcriptional regulator